MTWQSGSVWNRWVTLTDLGDSLGSKLFGGSMIYCFCNDFSLGGEVSHSINSNTMVAMDYFGSPVGSVWTAAIVNNNFTGVQNHSVTLKGNWTTDLGSHSPSGIEFLTPYKLILMATSGRTFYLQDERVIEQIRLESNESFYGSSGMPIVITNYSLNYGKRDNNNVTWNITVREDKV